MAHYFYLFSKVSFSFCPWSCLLEMRMIKLLTGSLSRSLPNHIYEMITSNFISFLITKANTTLYSHPSHIFFLWIHMPYFHKSVGGLMKFCSFSLNVIAIKIQTKVYLKLFYEFSTWLPFVLLVMVVVLVLQCLLR